MIDIYGRPFCSCCWLVRHQLPLGTWCLVGQSDEGMLSPSNGNDHGQPLDLEGLRFLSLNQSRWSETSSGTLIRCKRAGFLQGNANKITSHGRLSQESVLRNTLSAVDAKTFYLFFVFTNLSILVVLVQHRLPINAGTVRKVKRHKEQEL